MCRNLLSITHESQLACAGQNTAKYYPQLAEIVLTGILFGLSALDFSALQRT